MQYRNEQFSCQYWKEQFGTILIEADDISIQQASFFSMVVYISLRR